MPIVRPTTGPGAHDVLVLLREAKLADVLGPRLLDRLGTDRLEASGVLATAHGLWVVFDNVPHLVRVDAELPVPDPDATVVHHPSESLGFEDLALDAATGRFFTVIEAQERYPGVWMARVWEFDADVRPVRTRWLDLDLPSQNKGIEGISHLRRGGTEYLLALTEGNHGADGAVGRQVGAGRVHVFTPQDADSWRHVATIELPPSLAAVDYSGISVRDERIAVLSQCSGVLWTGYLSSDSWDIMDQGVTYRLPLDDRGRVVYGTAEGVSWLSANTVAIASDRAKREQPQRIRAKDQSLHVFRLP